MGNESYPLSKMGGNGYDKLIIIFYPRAVTSRDMTLVGIMLVLLCMICTNDLS
jgi:hypothetical protein